MKKIFLGLALISSLSAFADCSLLLTPTVSSYPEARLKQDLPNTALRSCHGGYCRETADLGLKMVTQMKLTGEVTPFGTDVKVREYGYEIYKDGRIVAQTNMSKNLESVTNKLILELKELGCK